MLWSNAPLGPIEGMTLEAFSLLAVDFGALRSQDAKMLDCESTDDTVTPANQKIKKSIAIQIDLMASATWKTFCQRLNQNDMAHYADQPLAQGAQPQVQAGIPAQMRRTEPVWTGWCRVG